MKVACRLGDVVRLREFVVAHILDHHLICDDRCVDLSDGALVVALSEPFYIPLEVDDNYWEFVGVGPTGVACFWYGDGDILA